LVKYEIIGSQEVKKVEEPKKEEPKKEEPKKEEPKKEEPKQEETVVEQTEQKPVEEKKQYSYIVQTLAKDVMSITGSTNLTRVCEFVNNCGMQDLNQIIDYLFSPENTELLSQLTAWVAYIILSYLYYYFYDCHTKNHWFSLSWAKKSLNIENQQ